MTSGSIIERIPPAASYLDRSPVVVVIGGTHGLQMILDLLPVLAGVFVHLFALTAILLSTVAGF